MTAVSRKEREKKVREEDIVAAAESVIDRAGFEAASMEEIAKEAQFTRKTVYQYFADKEDLFFEVAVRGFERLLGGYWEAEGAGTGYERLRSLGQMYYKFSQNSPGIFKLMVHVSEIRPKVGNASRLQRFVECNAALVRNAVEIIEGGQADGSIRADISPEQLAFPLEFLLTGLLHQLSIAGKSFTDHFSLDREEFAIFSLDLLLDGFSANKSRM